MLIRNISHRHIFRTNRLVLPRLRDFNDSQAPPVPTLDWTPGESRSGSSLEDPETPIIPISSRRAPPRRSRRTVNKVEVNLNPVLDWYPGERNADFSHSLPGLRAFDFEEPRLGWLVRKKDLIEEELVKKQKQKLPIRRTEGQPGGRRGRKNKSLVRRYELDTHLQPELEPEPKGKLLIRRLRAENKTQLEAPKKEEKLELAQGPSLKDSSKPSEGPQESEEQTKAGVGRLEARPIKVIRQYLSRYDVDSGKQEGKLVGRVQDVSNPRQLRTSITSKDYQGTFVGGQQTPLIRKVLNKPSTIYRGLPEIRTTPGRGFKFSATVKMEGQPAGNMGVNQIGEGTKEKVVNEAIPNDTNLIGGGNGQTSPKDNAPSEDSTVAYSPKFKYNTEANFLGENSTAASAQKPHDLKRANLGSYQKAPLDGNKKSKKRKVHVKEVKEGSNEVVLGYDIKDLLSSLNIEDSEDVELPEKDAEIKLTVSKLSSTGEGLAVYNGRVYTVPFGVPGDQVTATVRRHNDDHSVSKILTIDQPSPDRDDSIVGCKYFGTCNGCQFQMLPYAVQLEHKRKVVQRAFKNFSNLSPELLPEIGATMPSPLQYGYRTKLTPHFNGPRRGGFKEDMPIPNIGFFAKDPAYVMDIEDCPIGTDTVREGMTERRTFVKENLLTAFKRGATLLLRESTVRTYLEEAAEDGKKWVDKKLCITDHNARSIEYIGDLKFDNPAGSFFQNNNSILDSFTAYIRENLNLPVVKKAEGSSEVTETTERPKYLVDAYCGSGLFSITCGEGLEKVWGIDVDKSSIASARENAKANNIENADFIDSPAENIFGKLTFPGSETSLIIDPPRKGCDKRFLDQLLDFAPKRVVYVSCNVHTQARDIGYILSDERGKGYRIDSIRGCDFFPQTYHVEGVAVMTKID